MNTSTEQFHKLTSERKDPKELFIFIFKPFFSMKFMLFLVILTMLLLVRLSPFNLYLTEMLNHLKNSRENPFVLAAIFMLLVILYINCGGIRILVYPVSGAIFGYIYGLIVAQVSIILSYYIFFIIARYLLSFKLLRNYALTKFKKLNLILERNGALSVILIRQIPISGFLINTALALSTIKHSDFIIGSIIGTLPLALCCTLLGTSTTANSTFLLLFTSLVLLAGILFYNLKRFKTGKTKNKLSSQKKIVRLKL